MTFKRSAVSEKSRADRGVEAQGGTGRSTCKTYTFKTTIVLRQNHLHTLVQLVRHQFLPIVNRSVLSLSPRGGWFLSSAIVFGSVAVCYKHWIYYTKRFSMRPKLTEYRREHQKRCEEKHLCGDAAVLVHFRRWESFYK